MCARASYGPGAGLSPRASRGMRNARLAGSISGEETTSFFPILILMQSYLGMTVRRLKFVEIELLALRLSLTMGRRVDLAIENSLS